MFIIHSGNATAAQEVDACENQGGRCHWIQQDLKRPSMPPGRPRGCPADPAEQQNFDTIGPSVARIHTVLEGVVVK